jgi:hypothetical protein
MTKTKCNKVKNNKRLKIRKNKKQAFVEKLIKEWKKQINGCVKLDSTTEYKYDYYLLLNNYDDYSNHIHIMLKKKYHNHIVRGLHSTDNSIIYLMKKYDIDKSKIVHSKPRRVSIFSDPTKIVYEIIQEYNKFIHS